MQPTAAVLPPLSPGNEVSNYLAHPKEGLPDTLDIRPEKYHAGLSLDYVAPPVLGATFGGPFGSGVFAGTSFYFSDLLGNRNLEVGAEMNGGIHDLGGQIAYVLRRHRYDYGGYISRSPLRFESQFLSVSNDSLFVNNVTDRIKIDQAALLFSYPFSATKRVELSLGGARESFGTHVEQNVPTVSGALVKVGEFDINSGDVHFAQFSGALVGDNSASGLTGPLAGTRYRFEITPFVGSPGTFIQLRADYRKYFRLRPFTLAARGIHVGSYAGTATNDPNTAINEAYFTEQYLGLSNTFTFVRGYSFGSFDPARECTAVQNASCPEIQRLVGSRVALFSAELRLPVLGVRPVSLANFPLPVGVALFYDAGLAWNPGDNPLDLLKWSASTPDRVPVTSAGVSTRINILGFAVLEFYLAHAFQRPNAGLQFGFQIVPGW